MRHTEEVAFERLQARIAELERENQTVHVSRAEWDRREARIGELETKLIALVQNVEDVSVQRDDARRIATVAAIPGSMLKSTDYDVIVSWREDQR